MVTNIYIVDLSKSESKNKTYFRCHLSMLVLNLEHLESLGLEQKMI